MNEAHEQLEVYDAQGNPTGAAKSRAAIHRDGDWHLALFCWIVTTDGRVLLQKRAATKDVWPGRYDASAADTSASVKASRARSARSRRSSG